MKIAGILKAKLARMGVKRRSNFVRARSIQISSTLRSLKDDANLARNTVPARVLLRRTSSLLRPQAWWFVLIAACTTLSVVLATINPLISRALVDRAMFCSNGCPKPTLAGGLLAGMVAAMVLSGTLALAATFMNNTVGQRVVTRLRSELYERLTQQSMRFFTSVRLGELQTRLLGDISGINNVVTEAWPAVFQNTLGALAATVTMLVMSPQLTIVAVIFVVPLVIPARYITRMRRGIAASTREASIEMTVLAEETLSVSGALLTKVFGRQPTHIRRFNSENDRLARLTRRNEVLNRGLSVTMQFAYGLAPLSIYLVAELMLAHRRGSLTVGTILAFLGLQSRLTGSLQALVDVGVSISTSLFYFERIYEFLDLEPEIKELPEAADIDSSEISGSISVNSVSFSYHSNRQLTGVAQERIARYWALNNVSIDVGAGKVAAIVGPSGAGKSTLSYLISRLYDVDMGNIRIDGMDIRNLRLMSLSKIISMVTQEPYVLHATVRENLLYADPDATDEQMVAAARAALIHDRIMELEDGYETMVGERGYRLSGGERQRLALARVILRDPPILILDEATSSLDTRSERLIQSALERIKVGRTTIVIAHRLSTVINADVIFVLEHGQVVESGKHAELLAAGGLYAELYRGYFVDGAVESRNSDGVVLTTGQVIPAAGTS